jgi:metal-dependent amidase/aminoacylase/carboxypeptidase family protein
VKNIVMDDAESDQEIKMQDLQVNKQLRNKLNKNLARISRGAECNVRRRGKPFC